LDSILLWFYADSRVLLGEVAVKSGISELEQALEALEVPRAEGTQRRAA
jgi:hypothetical protein